MRNIRTKLAAGVTVAALAAGVTAPAALAQSTVTSDDSDSSNVAVEASQIQVADVSQVNTGDANAATDDGAAVAVISQDLFVEQDATQQVVVSGFEFFDGDLDDDGILDDFEVFDNDRDNDGFVD